MHIVQTRIPTANATRYLTQLCSHASAISGDGGGVGGGGGHEGGGHMRLPRHARPGGDSQEGHGPGKIIVERSGGAGVIRFEPQGRCVLEAADTELVVRIEALQESALERFRAIITADLTRFGRREKLQISWQRIEEPEEVHNTEEA